MPVVTHRRRRVVNGSVLANARRESAIRGASVRRQSIIRMNGKASGQRATQDARGVGSTLFAPLLLGVIHFTHLTINDCRRVAFKAVGMYLMIMKGCIFQGLLRRRIRVRSVPLLRRVLRSSMVMFFRRISVTMLNAPTLAKRVEGSITNSNASTSNVKGTGTAVRGTIRRATDRSTTRATTLRGGATVIISACCFLRGYRGWHFGSDFYLQCSTCVYDYGCGSVAFWL